MSHPSIHHTLLAPAILHILRAAGFHSTRPSVLDTLTDLCARYMLLLASRVVGLAHNRTALPSADGRENPRTNGALRIASPENETLLGLSSFEQDTPSLSDIRQALASVAFFTSALTATEEAWQEVLRKPIDAIPLAGREKERSRRDMEDTQDVREFIDWASGPVNREIRRIAGLVQEEQTMNNMVGMGPTGGLALAELSGSEKVDYVTSLKKKHSKTADGTRFSGTILGKNHEDRGSIRVEGGPGLAEVRAKRRVTNSGHETATLIPIS